MNALRILVLCVTASLVCASMRLQHPQIASAVALAAGVAALMLSTADIKIFSDAVISLENKLPPVLGERFFLLKLSGIALATEFASDICRDSGETALARRIEIGTKLALIAASIPAVSKLMETLTEFL